MAAFESLDWGRFDIWSIVASEGVAVVDSRQRDECLTWLQKHDYKVSSIDFRDGIEPALVEMGELFRWEEQFGYALASANGNLNALRDGFEFDLKPGVGSVLEILNADVAYQEDERWLRGLLSIAHEYSRWQLALGLKFFATLFLDAENSLSGVPYETLVVPFPYCPSGKDRNPFS